jgi:hypothetical protein
VYRCPASVIDARLSLRSDGQNNSDTELSMPTGDRCSDQHGYAPGEAIVAGRLRRASATT